MYFMCKVFHLNHIIFKFRLNLDTVFVFLNSLFIYLSFTVWQELAW